VSIAGLVLAAGASSRFGGPKVLARVDGRPLIEHVLATARGAGLHPIVVVVGDAAEAIESGVRWQGERLVRNPAPARGLASSLIIGLDEVVRLDPTVDGALVLLGDQPLTRPDVVAALLASPSDPARSVVAPRYAGGGGANPVLLRRSAFKLAGEAAGDRGLGPMLAARPELVQTVAVPGTNPDVDTQADLAAVAAEAWDRRVIANRTQVDRFREVADGADFYAPVSSLFRADPARPDDPFLEALLGLVHPDDTILDIGCGAGRYALPLAGHVREVIGVDPSAAMLAGLREGMQEHGIRNIRIVAGRWPAAAAGLGVTAAHAIAEVVLIAHVGYDVAPIGPFLDAMDAAARRQCVALLMDRAPASIADPFWPPVHGEARAALPAAGALLDLVAARGAEATVRWLDRPPRGYASREELVRFLRHQLWVVPGGAKDTRLVAAVDDLAEERAGKWYVRTDPGGRVGVIQWAPRRVAQPGRGSAGIH
jgi:molybdenum cofactor cytidylyltransferase